MEWEYKPQPYDPDQDRRGVDRSGHRSRTTGEQNPRETAFQTKAINEIDNGWRKGLFAPETPAETRERHQREQWRFTNGLSEAADWAGAWRLRRRRRSWMRYVAEWPAAA